MVRAMEPSGRGPIVIVVVGDGVADDEIVLVGGARSGDGLTVALPDRFHRFVSRFLARLTDPPVWPALLEKLVAPDNSAWATAPLDVKAFSHALFFLG